VLTHGFVLDEQGRAMHKSLGNVVSPQDVIRQWGADVLRLWVGLSDYSDDVRLSTNLLAGPAESYRKIRNTLRYLLGNTCDFDPVRHSVPVQDMPEMDRYLLHRLQALVAEVREAYEKYRFRAATKAISDFCILDLSSFYLDALKDRLYTFPAESRQRRSAQTVLHETLVSLLKLLAPVLSVTAEEAWQSLRRQLEALGSTRRLPESVFLVDFPVAREDWIAPDLERRWREVLSYRDRVKKLLESKRAAKEMGSSLEAKVVIRVRERTVFDLLSALGPAALAEAFIVSQVELDYAPDLPGQEDTLVLVERAEGEKCARCWRYTKDVGQDCAWPRLCLRCAKA